MWESSFSDSASIRCKAFHFDSNKVFDIPTRKPLKVNIIKAVFNIILAFGLIAALLTGYAIGLQLYDFGITSIGLYGAILISEYIIQFSCAIGNRIQVNRITDNLTRKRINASLAGDCEKGTKTTPTAKLLNPDGDVSIAVVGYREDEQAWRQCLRSLQTQTLHPKCVVGVVDGNEEPDLDMARAFVDEFKGLNAPLIHLPILLSDLHRDTYFKNLPADKRSMFRKIWHWLTGGHRPGHAMALSIARQVVIEQILRWNDEWNISSLDAVCFSQPHGHKRTAMFTAFAMSLYALRTRDSIFTTDSDTLVQDNALDEMLTLLRSEAQLGGVTADVKIWNRSENLLARLCSARYWFAFNIERACQSLWRCVGCLSGPMSMYRASDLETILGPWNLQTFGGKATTFGDDRHLTNQLLAHGLNTRYTHRTWCDSESPTAFNRWVTQQTRWSKSFFRETFWFPASFVYQAPWMLVETTIQTLYPFILIATCFHFLFESSNNDWRPLIWLGTMFAIAFFKSSLAMLMSHDPWLLLFSFYGFVYFFGLLPSKIWALFTMNQTGWGTSARSSSERKRGQSFLQRSFHVGHLVIWYSAVFTGLGFFLYRIFQNPLYFLVAAAAILLSLFLYWQPSLSIAGLGAKVRGVLGKRKPAPRTSYVQVNEENLPQRPSPVLLAEDQPPAAFKETDTKDIKVQLDEKGLVDNSSSSTINLPPVAKLS
ncbi:uncharacterized protein PV09_06174 [Verruconis gallopava]|uniref:Glycosyltransferase 2-like domain-containing protein n=1 Tax=Verruconis gallopava TaxID=253628 RepID=A0A0D1YNS3_9PEZI|nr:uncharacterized protein PV09_06174 [Verruconis gallopava]KIW02352.1 hypothetical protein PV09_06174 [Verruconis gallopava]